MALPSTADFDRVFGSKYVSKDDIGNERIHTNITDIKLEQVREKDGTTKSKYVVYFADLEKGLVLNSTNGKALQAVLGKDASRWIGAEVIVFVDFSVIFNNNRGGVRLQVLPPKKPPAKRPGPAPTDPDLNDDDDDILFDR